MPSVDYANVIACMRRIGAVIHARDDRDAQSACWRLLFETDDGDVVFATVQALRDLETITEFEAVYLFHELFDAALGEGEEEEDDGDAEREAEFLRDRGEAYLAHVRLSEENTWFDWCDDGRFSLVDDRRAPDARLLSVGDEATVDALVDQIARLLDAAAGDARWRPGLLWGYAESVPAALVGAAVRATARCRDQRLLSEEDARSLIHDLLSPVVVGMLRSDRGWREVQCEIARHRDKPVPAELTAYEQRRWRRLWVHCLRACGEQVWAEAELRGSNWSSDANAAIKHAA